MPLVTYISHDGTENEIEVPAGNSVMQGAVDNMLDGIIAECGGSCSCATCHCYVDEAWLDKIPPASEMEKDMLECVLEPQDNSRLSCQIDVTEELNGLVIRLPESQF
jgi:2Fe-2S ferredoxin